MSNTIIQFAKEPQAGKVKTRLIPALSAAQAMALHQRLTRRCLSQLVCVEDASHELWVSGNAEHDFFQQLSGEFPTVRRKVQSGRDLGERLAHAVQTCLASCTQLIIVGSDCPFIDTSYLQKALAALHRHDAVIGPALDGGYVLLGLKTFRPEIFANIDWGTDRVLAQTLEALEAIGWRYLRLDSLPDIDRPEDLTLLDGIVFD